MMNNWTADFPILAADENGNRLVYLDSAATTQHPKQVLDAVVNYYNKDNANPHRGVYELAMRAMPWLTVYGEPVADGRYGVVSFNVNDVHPHDVATILDAGGVAVRAGHHCAQPLMEYLGIGSCCRASVAIYNTAEDVDALLENLENVRKVMGL